MAVLATAIALAGCENEAADRGTGSAVAAPTTLTEVTVEAQSEASWASAADPPQLVAMSDLVVLAKPLGDGERLLGASRITANAVDEYYARKFEVLDVLAGEGVGPGDQIEVARGSSVVAITDSSTGTTTRQRTVGGGYPGPLEGDAFIFGLSQDFPGASSGAWVVVSGAHGMILFAGQPSELVVAAPRTGYDGQLQRVLTGLSVDEVRDLFP